VYQNKNKKQWLKLATPSL